MKRCLFCLVLAILLCASAYSQGAQNEKFVGILQDCFIHCGTYHINPDFTFKHKFNGEVKYGTWKYIGKNKIKLYAPGKKAETAFLTGRNNNGEIVKVKLKIPKIPAFKEIFIFQNDSICTLDKKGKAEFCYKKVETNSQNN